MRGDHLPKLIEWFNEHRQELLAEHRGKIAVVYDQKLVGIYDTFSEAYVQGTSITGSPELLVKQILEVDPVFYCPSFWPVDPLIPPQTGTLTVGSSNDVRFCTVVF